MEASTVALRWYPKLGLGISARVPIIVTIHLPRIPRWSTAEGEPCDNLAAYLLLCRDVKAVAQNIDFVNKYWSTRNALNVWWHRPSTKSDKLFPRWSGWLSTSQKNPSCAKLNYTKNQLVDSKHIVRKNLTAHFCGESNHLSVFNVFLFFVDLKQSRHKHFFLIIIKRSILLRRWIVKEPWICFHSCRIVTWHPTLQCRTWQSLSRKIIPFIDGLVLSSVCLTISRAFSSVGRVVLACFSVAKTDYCIMQILKWLKDLASFSYGCKNSLCHMVRSWNGRIMWENCRLESETTEKRVSPWEVGVEAFRSMVLPGQCKVMIRYVRDALPDFCVSGLESSNQQW